MDATLPSLLGFAVTMYITPGPNNVMIASSAATRGVRRTLPHMLGVNAGFTLMLVLVSAGLGAVLLRSPVLLNVMRWVGAAWMVVLAWKIATAPPPGQGADRKLLGFPGAMAFQWVNPKAWMISVAAAGAFLLPTEPLWTQVLRIGIVFLLVGLPCMLPWAVLGTGAGRLLHARGRLRAFNLTMAGLLVLSVLPVLLER